MNHFARRTAAGGAALVAATGLLLAAGCGDDDKDKVDSAVSSVITTLPGGAGSETTTDHADHTDGSATATTGAGEGTGSATSTATAAGESTTISGPNGDITVSGEVYKKYVAAGGAASPLGAPEEAQESGPNGGQYQDFEGGTVYWSPETGAHIVWGEIREAWEENGGANGTLGYPTSDEKDIPGGKQSDFTGGTITWVGGQTTVTPK
ncbi:MULTISPECIES: LGFP repeat-containing protein [unclassified Nocardia]|uniref:LGFP repeat-containing protein n=1 Tax=Nocardia sp. NPDC050413 TaxID=3155784 RepID=UPI0033C86C31